MIRIVIHTFATVFLAVLMAVPGQAQSDWMFWRGPLGNGVAPDATPPVRWSETENIRWKVEIPGDGSATPIVLGNRVFITTAVPKQDDEASGETENTGFWRRGREIPEFPFQYIVQCHDRATGEVLWSDVAVEAVPHEGTHGTNTYAAGSPVTDGEMLYVTFGSRGIFGYTLDGEQLWSRDLGDQRTRNQFGEGSSLTVHDGNLLVLWDHEEDSFLYNLNAENGETIWQVPREEKTTWSTPIVVEAAGKTQVVVNGSNRVISYDLETGEAIWKCGGQTGNTIPVPVLYKDMAIVMSGWRGGACFALPLDAEGDITGSDSIRWSYTERDTPYVPSPTMLDNILFFTQNRSPILTALNADTGEVVIETTRLTQLPGEMYSSLNAANGNVYITSRRGDTLVFTMGEEGMEEIAVNLLDDVIDSSMAIVDDQIFLRGMDTLYCIQES